MTGSSVGNNASVYGFSELKESGTTQKGGQHHSPFVRNFTDCQDSTTKKDSTTINLNQAAHNSTTTNPAGDSADVSSGVIARGSNSSEFEISNVSISK